MPFRIRPGAPTSSIDVAASGDVGIGTTSAVADLHIFDSATGDAAANAALRLQSAAGSFDLRANWLSGNFEILDVGTNHVPFVIQEGGFTENNILVINSDGVGVKGNPGSSNDFRVNGTAEIINLTVTGTFTNTSDINAKENFSNVDPTEILERVSQLPITTWNYRSGSGTHIGPMAQDFYASFGLGESATGISPLDVGSVALVAIQELDSEVKAKDRKIDDLERRNVELEERLAALEAMVATLSGAVE